MTFSVFSSWQQLYENVVNFDNAQKFISSSPVNNSL